MNFFLAISPCGEFGLLLGFPAISLCTLLLSVWNTVVSHFLAISSVSRLTVNVRSSWSCLVFLGLKVWNAVGVKIRVFMDHCFFCSIFKIIYLLVHQFLRTFQSVYITYNFEQKFHASELFISLGIWNEMKKMEKEKHFYEEIFKIIKNIIKILIVDIFPLHFFSWL